MRRLRLLSCACWRFQSLKMALQRSMVDCAVSPGTMLLQRRLLYSRRNGSMALRMVSVSCRVRRGGRIAELTVADDGIGMPRHVLTRALLPGFTSRPHGTGLGLPRVSELVAKAKGSLHIRSAEGKGTRIVVRLPLIAPVAIA